MSCMAHPAGGQFAGTFENPSKHAGLGRPGTGSTSALRPPRTSNRRMMSKGAARDDAARPFHVCV